MQTILKRYLSQSYATRAWIAMLVVLTLCLGATVANAAPPSKSAVVMTQVNWLAKYPNGGALAGSLSGGISFGVNSRGDVIFSTTYGSTIQIISGRTGALSQLGSYSNAAAVAVDGNDNLYVSGQYKNMVAKIPYVGGAYSMPSDPSGTAPPACTGTDTAMCALTMLNGIGYFGTTAMAFDAQGNMFMATNDQGATHSIYKCGVTCLSGTDAPVLLFKEPGSTLYLGGMAVDPWGNLFFTDSNFIAGDTSSFSNVNVLPYTGTGTGYAAAPTVLYTLTIASPTAYDNEIDGVAVSPDGTVYFADHDGIYAFPNTGGTLDAATVAATVYTVSAQGGKALTKDVKGNLYVAAYTSAFGSGGDGVGQVTVGSVSVPSSAVGTPASNDANVHPVTTILNDGACASQTISFTAAVAGKTTTEYSAEVTGTCKSTLTGHSAFPTSITHTPVAGGLFGAVLIANDSVNKGFANFAITPAPGGAKRGDVVVSQTNWLAKYPNGGALAGSLSGGISFGVNSQGDAIFSTTYGSTVQIINGQTGALSQLGSYSNAAAVAVDGNDNLYVSGQYKNMVAKIPYVGGAYSMPSDPSGTAPPACTGTDTAMCALTKLNGIGYFGTTAMAFDAQGNMFMATNDQGATHSIYKCGVTCLSGTDAPVLLFKEPGSTLYLGGMAVDPWGNLFFTDSNFIAGDTSSFSNVNVLPYTGAGTTGYAAAPTVLYTLTIANPSAYDNEIDGIAVGSNGTVYFADHGGIYAFPNNGGGLNAATVAATVYTVSAQGGKALTIDQHENLYVAAYTSALGSGGDSVGQVMMNNALVPNSRKGAEVSNDLTQHPVSAILNDASCSSTPAASVLFDFGTSTTAMATGTAGGSCASTLLGGAILPATVKLTPNVVGPASATTIATDQAGNTAAVTVMGTGLPGGTTQQTITWAAIGPQSAAVPLSLTATASSNLPVTFSSMTPSLCAVSGNLATFLGAGNCTIHAAQSGDDTYAAVTMDQTFTVSLTAQTISFTEPGDQIIGAVVELAVSSSNPNIDVTLTSLTTDICTLDSVTLTTVRVGTCTIEATQPGDALHSAATPVQVTFQVKAPNEQTITFDNPGTQMVGYPIQLQATATSQLAVSFASTTPTICTVMNTTANFVAAGQCTIVATQRGNKNYAAAEPVAQTFAVIAVTAQTITFDNPGAQRIDSPLTLSAAATSLLPITFTATTTDVCTIPAATPNKVTFANTGTCSITASQAGSVSSVPPFAPAPSVTQTFEVKSASWTQYSLESTTASLDFKQGEPSSAVVIKVSAPDGFIGKVSFSCSGAPEGYNCSFYPQQISLPTATWTSMTLTPTTTAAAGTTHPVRRHSGPMVALATMTLMGFCLLGSEKRRGRIIALLAAVIIGLLLLSSCGTGSKPTQGTVTVTATSGTIHQSTTINFTIRQ